MCFVPVKEGRTRRRPLSWLLSSAQNHSHTKTLSLSRSFWLQGRESIQTTLSPKWRTLIKTQGFLMQPKEGNAVEPQNQKDIRHQSSYSFWLCLVQSWGLVPVDCRWLFQPELQGPTPRGQKIHVYIVQAIVIVDFLSFSAKPSPLHQRALKEAILVVCSLFSIYS